MSNFLLEIMVEEIPSRFQEKAVVEFVELLKAEFEKNRIIYEKIRSYISPRRIVFSADLNPKISEFTEEKKGPQAGAPAEIIEKFLKANGISRAECIEKNIDKKVVIFANIKHPSKSTSDVLPAAIKNAILGISWPKSMHWNKFQLHFVRPLRGIMAIFDNELVDVDFGEIGLKSRDHTFGHRFLAPAKITASDINEYLNKTKNACVIVDANERKNIISDGIKKLESENNITVEVDESLLKEVVGLVEYPVVLLGKIPEKFMTLPEEAIITPMRTHQRYFPTRKDGKLAPYFVFVANNATSDDGKTIVTGNERVLNARLADALFFFETDLKKPLESHLEDLKKITFNEKLGTVYDRIKRVINVCDYVSEEITAKNKDLISAKTVAQLKRTATLAKCDLSTTMVCEFTELQGIMGAYYARIQGENDDVCDAIRDQYKPVEEISSLLSALFSLADKIELITSFFAIGKEPTGSKDPFALRRAAIGILKIIKKHNIVIDIENVIQKAFSQLNIENSHAVEKVIAFIIDRLKVVLKESGVAHNIVTAVTTQSADIFGIFQKSDILSEVLQTEVGEKLISGFKRAKNIVESNRDTAVDVSLFTEKEESELFNEIIELENQISKIEEINDNGSGEKFRQQLYACVEIEQSVSNFFDKVLVNTEDEKMKQNRLNMLSKLVSIFDRLGLHDVLCNV